MKNKSFDVSLVAFLGFFILSAGLFTVFSTGNVKSVYQSITATVPAAESQLAQVAVGQSVDVTGWAWSSNTGWISFNDTNLGAGGGNYQVKVIKTSSTLGTFDGYAWSSNIGWISFKADDVSNCPTGSGCTAAINLSTGAVTGWARILSMKTENSANGWLQLSGLNHETSGGGGVVYDRTNGDLTGMAWESTAMGWTSFDAKIPNLTIDTVVDLSESTCTRSSSDYVESDTLVTFTANPKGGSGTYTYNWDSGAGSNKTYGKKYTDTGAGPTLVIKDTSNPVNTFSPKCPKVDVTTVNTGNLDLFIGPTITSTKKSHAVRQGTKFALNWTNRPPSSFTCNMSVTNSDGIWQNNIEGINIGLANPSNNGNATNLTTTDVERGLYKFTMTCTNNIANPNSNSKVSTVELLVISADSEEF